MFDFSFKNEFNDLYILKNGLYYNKQIQYVLGNIMYQYATKTIKLNKTKKGPVAYFF